MLKLRGKVTELVGFSTDGKPIALRLNNPKSKPLTLADVGLIKKPNDYSEAIKSGFDKFLFLNGSEALAANSNDLSYVVMPSDYDYLEDGDIIGLTAESGQFRSLYRRGSAHNSFFVTERCNHYCLMCSQPPRNVEDQWLLDEISVALPLVDKSTRAFSFTGGEPLLNADKFINVLSECAELLPDTLVHVLTNGRAFANTQTAKAWADTLHPHLTAGIPIYSAVDYLHDYVVQAKGALNETVLGILNLKNLGQRVEVRIVLHAITAPRIFETCRWLSRNLPFVDHVALMGLENTGFALANEETLLIDPVDYVSELERAVEALAIAGMQVSIYNLPRCLLPHSLWPFAVQSISDWKRGYIDECIKCIEQPNCSGFFTTGRLKPSRGIAAII